MIKNAILAWACMGLLAALPAMAQGLLDEQLGPTATLPGTPASSDKPVDSKPVDEVKPPVAAEIVSPDAVKKVDDDELIKDLITPGSDKLDPDRVAAQMKAMLERMGVSGERLNQRDPGEVTQETQRRIVMDLDIMIELARRQQQQQSSSSSSQQQQQPGQQRQPGQNQGPTGPGGTQAATGDPLPRGGITDAVTGDMRNRDPASWGGLPPRDRDQISHGANEDYLNSYREMIDRYYQALAEIGRSSNR